MAMAKTPPIQIVNGACDFSVSAAAEIWPGSPHSAKKSEPNETIAALDQEPWSAGVSLNGR